MCAAKSPPLDGRSSRLSWPRRERRNLRYTRLAVGLEQTAEKALMSILGQRFRKSLRKRQKHGFRSYPVATVAYYGPDDQRASKVALGIVRGEGAEAAELRRWSSRTLMSGSTLPSIARSSSSFAQGARTVAGVDRIIGCPHEEGVDHPQGAPCPACRFWTHRDRWTGEAIH